MSDKVEAAVYQRIPAWHNKGTVVDADLRTWEEVRAHLDLHWDIVEREVSVDGRLIPGFHGAVRTDTGKVLAINANSYALIGLDAFGRFVARSMRDQAATWDSLVVMDRGLAMAATIKLDEPYQVPGDPSPVFPYVGYSNRVDGKGALIADPTAVRQVCWNTNSLFLMQADRSGWATTFRHTGSLDMEKAADEVAQTLELAREAFTGFKDTAKALAEKQVDPDDFLSHWLPIRQHMSDAVVTRLETKREAFKSALTGPRAVDNPDTAWGVLQAAVDAYQYAFPVQGSEKGREKRTFSMISSRMGARNPINSNRSDDLRRAYRIAMDMAEL